MKRLQLIASHISFWNKSKSEKKKNSLLITDERTGKQVQIPIYKGFIKSQDLQSISFRKKVLRSYDPGYMNTIACDSAISYIDGNKGILEYRGYSIESLCEKATFMQVAFLLIHGQLPPPKTIKDFNRRVQEKMFIHTDLQQFMACFRYDSNPMSMMCSVVSALSTFYPSSNPSIKGEKIYQNRNLRNQCIYQIMGKVPTIAANAYRHRIGRQYNMPHYTMPYVQNFLFMLDSLNEQEYKPNPIMVKVLEKLFIIHAEHQLNCSTAAVRHLASSGTDIFTVIAGAAGALSGSRHGRNSEMVLNMLQWIGTKDKIPQFIQDVKNKKILLYGFGHRVYKNQDPRVKLVKGLMEDVFKISGNQQIVQLAVQLQNYARKQSYFIERNLYPNVDFYTGIIYKALRFPNDMFPVLFMIPRVVGWLAHWNQFMQQKTQRIVRPRQNFNGHNKRKYVAMSQREKTHFQLSCDNTNISKRNLVAHNQLINNQEDEDDE